MDYTRRSYRQGLCPAGMKAFTVTIKETDLWLAVDSSAMSPDLPEKVEQFVWRERRLLERFISEEPAFLQALEPYVAGPGAPAIALDMVRAGNMAGVGPMAAVAGAFAQYVGEWLLQLTSQVIVENGGDIFLCCNHPVKVGIFAAESPFNEKLAIRIAPREEPRESVPLRECRPFLQPGTGGCRGYPGKKRHSGRRCGYGCGQYGSISKRPAACCQICRRDKGSRRCPGYIGR